MGQSSNKAVKCGRVVNAYIYTASTLLFASGLAKLISITAQTRILQELDPLIGIKYKYLFAIAGSIEIILAIVGFSAKPIYLRVLAIAWVSTGISTYRFGLIWIGYHGACGCLGSLTQALHISPQTADTAMKAILVYLLVGAYAATFWLWRQRNGLSTAALK